MNRKTNRASTKLIAMLLTLIMVVGLLPMSAFAVPEPGAKITAIGDFQKTYEVENGTALSEVNLPEALPVTVEIPAELDGGEPSYEDDTAAVTWIGDYDPSIAAEYTLTAAFTDETLVYSDEMPDVTVTVVEAVMPLDDSPTAPGGVEAAIPSIFTLEWTSVANGSNLTYDDNGVCQLTPSINSFTPTTPGTFAQCAVTFSVGGDIDAQPGDVKIRLPRHIFEDRSGSSVGTFTIGVSDAKEGTTGFYYYIDEEKDEIVLENFNTIDTAYIFTCNITYSSGGQEVIDSANKYYCPSLIADKYQKNFAADVAVSIYDAETIHAQSDSISVQYNTHVSGNLRKNQQGKYETWQETWGEAPENSEDYFYVSWGVLAETYGTQPHTITITDSPEDGEIVGWTDSYRYENCANNVGKPMQRVITTPTSSASGDGLGINLITRHPRSELDTKKEFTNNASVEITGVDGAKVTDEASAKYEYVDLKFIYPGDKFTVDKSTIRGISTTSAGYLNRIANAESGQSAGRLALPSDDYYFRLVSTTVGWSLTLEEGADGSIYENYGKKPYTIELTDDLVTLSDERLTTGDYCFTELWLELHQSNYKKSENGKWYPVDANDYENWEPLELQYQTQVDGAWTKLGTISRTGPYIYTFTDNDGNTNDINIRNKKETLALPANVTGVRTICNTTYYQTLLSVYLNVALNNTAHVQQLIAGKDSATLINVDTLRVLDDDGKWANQVSADTISGNLKPLVEDRDTALYGANTYAQHWSAKAELTRIYPKLFSGKHVEYTNDPAQGLVKAHYTLTGCSFLSGDESGEELKKYGALNEERNGTFYDLLPSGMSVLNNSIKVSEHPGYDQYSSEFPCDYTVSFVDNWQDSGRTMMIINVTVPESRENFHVNNSLYSGFVAEYDAYYPWEYISIYGVSPLNSVAYASEYAFDNAFADDASSNKYFDDRLLFIDLDADGNPEGTPKNTAYSQVKTSFNLDTSAELSYTKKVKGPADANYKNETTTVCGGVYSYRLRTASAANYETSNIIFYDSIEVYDADFSNRWRGTIESVDTSFAHSKGINVVVYYSTVPALDIQKNSPNLDLTNTDIWTTAAPTDLSTVTSLAFDMRKDKNGNNYVLPELDSVYVVINMRAESENVPTLEDADAVAYNSGWQSATTTNKITGASDNDTLESQPTKVHIEVPDLELHKTSDPETGTVDAPALVEENDELTYDISIVNKESAFSFDGITIVDTIPVGLTIDFDNIKWYSGTDSAQAKLISTTNRLNVTRNEQTLTFTVDELYIHETIHFLIPTTVNEGGTATKFENTARTTTVNGSRYELESETTYHYKEAPTGNLTVGKTVSGNAARQTKDFTFTVTLGDRTITGTFDGMTFINGVATFTLKHGESKTATGLPAGVIYTVVESDNTGYTVTVNGTTDTQGAGTIIANKTAAEAFNNEKNETPPPAPQTGNLTVGKTVSGNAASQIKDFTFTVTLGDKTITGTYGGVIFADGVASFTLKHGDSKTATGLPAGTTYTVVESDNTGYTVTVNGTADTQGAGTIIANETAAEAFNNERNTTPPPTEPNTGNLVVSKTVSGNIASQTKDFTFTVTLSDKSISGTYGNMIFINGVATFTLKHGDSKTATGLPAGVIYTVVESDNTGYTVTVNGAADTQGAGTIIANETAAEAFNNYKSGGGHTPNPAKITLEANKTLDGKAPSGSSFTFFLKNEKGNIIQTKQNNGGTIVFDELTFSASGTYTYTISEKIVTGDGITYDKTVYSAVIIVTKDGDYKASVQYAKDGATYIGTPLFANTTTPVTPPTPEEPTEPSTPPSTPDEPKKPVTPDKPVDNVPQTGDNSNTGLWLVIMCFSMFGLGATLLIGSKKRYRGTHQK